MMLTKLFSTVLLAIGVSHSASQSAPITTSTWNLYGGSDPGVEFTLKTALSSSSSTWPGQTVVNFDLTVILGQNVDYLQGLSLELMNDNLFCATGTQSDCLPLPSDPSYPGDKLYHHQASRKWFLSFVNTAKTTAIICRYALMDEFCKTKSECDALGWSDSNTLMSEMKTKSTSSDNKVFKFLSNNADYKITFGSKTASGNTIRYQYKFDIPDQFFRMGSSDPTYDLGLTTGATRYISFGLWRTGALGSQRNDCTRSTATGDANFRKLFDAPFYITSAFPWTAGREDQYSGRFVTFPVPTAAPTDKPTLNPTTANPTLAPTTKSPTKAPTTQKPSKAPTDSPTKKPTTPVPSKAPTTAKPSKNPTLSPTKKPSFAPSVGPTKAPTTGSPSKAPTLFPTKAPTTQKPSRAPTVFPTRKPSRSPTPGPTAGPVQFFCPNPRNQELCQRINTWFQHFTNDVSRRMKNVKRLCVAYGCHWCTYPLDGVPLGECRPMYPEQTHQYKQYTYEQACPKDRSDPFEDCDMFPDCPPPEEMTICRELNTIPGYKKNLCENGFSLSIGGAEVSVGAKRCAYDKGKCRAVGDYFWARKTIVRIPGYFDRQRGCPYAQIP